MREGGEGGSLLELTDTGTLHLGIKNPKSVLLLKVQRVKPQIKPLKLN